MAHLLEGLNDRYPGPGNGYRLGAEGMPQLNAKERAIIACLADGMQSKEIAASVRLSKASIDTYVRILFGKFNARSRAQLVALSYAAGVLTVREPHI